jgi:hypothetical protein
MSIPYNLEVEASYSVDVDGRDIDLNGMVTIDTEDMLDQLDSADVIAYYKKNNQIDTELRSLVMSGNITTENLLEFLKDEKARDSFADIDLAKIIKELQ